MNKVAIIVLADTESHESLGRIVNALEFAKELKENNDEVKIVFDGGGVTWVPELENEEHDLHPIYEEIKDHIHGACRFCAKAFGVFKEVKESDVALLDEYDQHPSIRSFIVDGYQVITF